MVEVAQRRAAELGLDNVDFAVIDAQQLELEPARFDSAICRWGYMLIGDPDEAMRGTRLALRDAGRLALADWDRPDRNLWVAAPSIALVTQGQCRRATRPIRVRSPYSQRTPRQAFAYEG
jgi:ubiquinone/menaquinone biosynthesis C-methylase UbiE